MTVKRKHKNTETFYYITFTCFKWKNLFEISSLYDRIYKWFEILPRYQTYNCGYVIMPNHLHTLLYPINNEKTIDKIIGNCKRFLAYEIVKRLTKNREEELLFQMVQAVSPSSRKKNKLHEVFEESFDCKKIITENFIRQKLNYIHKNPVSGKWNLVDDYLNYEHSSARFYEHNEKSSCSLFHYQELLQCIPTISMRCR